MGSEDKILIKLVIKSGSNKNAGEEETIGKISQYIVFLFVISSMMSIIDNFGDDIHDSDRAVNFP